MVHIQLMLLIFSLIISSTYGAAASSNSHYISNSCQQINSSSSTLAYQTELNSTLWNQLLPKASNLNFYNFTNGTSKNQVYALFYCKGDIDKRACQGCIQAATSKITDVCRYQTEGIVWFEECTLRYADKNIFSIDQEFPSFLYYNYSGIVSADRLGSYQESFDSTMAALIQQAAYSNEKNSRGFAIKEIALSLSGKLRGFAQCSPDIIGDPCYKCLKTALRVRDTWANTMVFLPSCFVRYDVYGKADPLSQPPPPPPSIGPLKVRSIIPIVVCSVVVFILLAVIGLCLWKRKSRKHRKSRKQETEPVIPDNPSIVTEENVQRFRSYSPSIATEEKVQGFRKYTYSQLSQMTGGFTTQIGQGAFGVVYHGYLLDGSKEVAVKVLNERDAPRQFHNEINVFGKISHKNLVSLLGYCEDGSKLALVYEYMNKGDLRVQLSANAGSLSWAKRLEIAIGTAEGLHYLHNHCEEHIVHRDVKPDNILLTGDGELLQAKVADFGISKIFPAADVTTLETRIMGSHGYTAPEYYTTGLLNEKADVYSFGVVLLELITGITPRLGFNLVAIFERMFNAGDIEKIVDTRLIRDMNSSSVWGATELARTCIEADQNKRPNMWEIVVKLKQCLDMQMKNVGSSSTGSYSMEMMPVMAPYSTTMYRPEAR